MKPLFRKLQGALSAGWKQWLIHAAVLLLILGVGGLIVAVSGIMPIKASAGHWAITEWFLQFSKRRSVDTHTLQITVPSLDDPALRVKGAGHYHLGCMPCHGSPELKHPPIPQHMLPPPPYLPDDLSEWDTAELFYIVKHGLKFTGMPAWPSQQRDDEVWAVVAFLQAMPELDAQAYRELATGQTGKTKAPPLSELSPQEAYPSLVEKTCRNCHGVEGESRGYGAFPKLAGQPAEYLAASLQAYKEGKRQSGIMQPIAAALEAADITELSNYYSERQRTQTNLSKDRATPDQDAIARGKKIAEEGLLQRRLPACVDCHGPTQNDRNPHYPNLAGLSAKYLTLQLELFQRQQRGGTKFADLMDPVAKNINAEQIRDVAAYYESLKTAENPEN